MSEHKWTSEESQAYNRVIAHAAFKGLQASSLLAPPLFALYTTVRRRPHLALNYMRVLTLSGVGSSAAGTLAAAGTMRGNEVERVTDRDFRLSHNESQRLVDQRSLLGGTAAGALGASFAMVSGVRDVPIIFRFASGSACLGMGAAVLYHVAMMRMAGEKVSPKGMEEEVKGFVKTNT